MSNNQPGHKLAISRRRFLIGVACAATAALTPALATAGNRWGIIRGDTKPHTVTGTLTFNDHLRDDLYSEWKMWTNIGPGAEPSNTELAYQSSAPVMRANTHKQTCPPQTDITMISTGAGR